jgi:hypothetical protein
MDIFEGMPPIDWSRFAQGSVSNPMWQSFTGLVKLCHCVEHWRNSAQSARYTRRPKPLYPQSPHMKRENQAEWDEAAEDYEARMRRAAHLAGEQLLSMSQMAVNEGTPDWKLCATVALLIGPKPPRIKSVALEAFDAAALTNAEPDAIATVWLHNAVDFGEL